MDKEKSSVMGMVLSGVGGIVLGFGLGWVANDMSREAETAPTAPKKG